MSFLARELATRYNLTEIRVFNSAFLDEESWFFFKLLRDVGNVKIMMSSETTSLTVNIILAHEEIELCRAVYKRDTASLLQIAETYLCVGNHWAVIRLTDLIEEQSASWARLRAVAHIMADKPFEAECYYKLWRDLGTDEDLIKANYGLSMLYLRHHIPLLRNLDIATTLLQEAYETACRINSGAFARIFNRNGYGLVLFRLGQVNEAIELLSWVVSELDQLPGKIALMHKSVIIYNIAQCHFALNNTDAALKLLKQLLFVDPNYPEYHMEVARNYIAAGHIKHAIGALEDAIALEKSIPEAYAQKGHCHMEKTDFSEAIEAFSMALSLQPHDPDVTYAKAYALSMSGRYYEICDFLQRSPLLATESQDRDNLLIVYAEALSFTQSKQAAIQKIEELSPKTQRSPEIEAVVDLLQSGIGNV